MPSVSFYTMGCNVNLAETEKLCAMFSQAGFKISEGGDSDAIVINSCAVTQIAAKGAAQLVKRLRIKNARAVIAVVGCAGELLAQDGAKPPPEADFWLGNDKYRAVDIISKRIFDKNDSNDTLVNNHIKIISGAASCARSYVLVQSGCDRRCGYCVVPRLRGGPVSVPLDEIRQELLAKAEAGCAEAVLSGVNLSLYADGPHRLPDVMRMADKIGGIRRVRLSSLEPNALDDEFIEAARTSKKLCPRFHVSLQSGCDATLAAMDRGYAFGEYYAAIEKLREAVHGASVTTDIIVGYPGESDKNFRECCANIVKCRFDDIHIFKFSLRAGTKAADMPGSVGEHKKAERALLLQGIKQQARYSFLYGSVGQTERALFLTRPRPGKFEGETGRGARVTVESCENLLGQMRDVKIYAVSPGGDGLAGEL